MRFRVRKNQSSLITARTTRSLLQSTAQYLLEKQVCVILTVITRNDTVKMVTCCTFSQKYTGIKEICSLLLQSVNHFLRMSKILLRNYSQSFSFGAPITVKWGNTLFNSTVLSSNETRCQSFQGKEYSAKLICDRRTME